MHFFTRITTSFLWIVILLPFASLGQSTAPLGALPMQYNSSFAGSNAGPRVSAFSSYERYNYNKANLYQLYTSYDQFIPAIRSGIGITANLGGYKSPTINSTYGFLSAYNVLSSGIAVAIAPKFSLKGKYTISPSLDFTYGQSAYSAYTHSYYPEDSIYSVPAGKTHSYQSRIGLLFNTNKLYIGYSVYLLDQTSLANSFILNRIKNIFTSHLQLGYTFQRSSTSAFSFTPQLVFNILHASNPNTTLVSLEAFNFTFRYNKFIWGFNNVGMRLGEITSYKPFTFDTFKFQEFKHGSIHLGWQSERIRLMLSTNLSFLSRQVNDFRFYTLSTSFRYLIPSKLEKKYTVPGM